MDRKELFRLLEQYPDEMSVRERSQAYKRGEQVDRIPTSISVRDCIAPSFGFTMGEYRRDFSVRTAVYDRAHALYGCEGVTLGCTLKKLGEALGATLFYPENGIELLRVHPIRAVRDFTTLEIPRPEENTVLRQQLDEIRLWLRHYGEAFPIGTEVPGPMSTAISLCPAETVLSSLIRHPDDTAALLEFSADCAIEWVRAAHRIFGITSVGISDPAASLSLVSPAMFRRFIVPPMQRMLREIHGITGKTPSLHICGKTAAIWQDIADMGFASFRVDNCESLAALKSAVGSRMGISGNIPPVEVLLRGSIDEVFQSACRCIREGADNPRGFTLAGGCQPPPGVPQENFLAMLCAARVYGRGARMGQPCAGID